MGPFGSELIVSSLGARGDDPGPFQSVRGGHFDKGLRMADVGGVYVVIAILGAAWFIFSA